VNVCACSRRRGSASQALVVSALNYLPDLESQVVVSTRVDKTGRMQTIMRCCVTHMSGIVPVSTRRERTMCLSATISQANAAPVASCAAASRQRPFRTLNAAEIAQLQMVGSQYNWLNKLRVSCKRYFHGPTGRSWRSKTQASPDSFAETV
jgi:hypothetical protein